MDTSETYIKMCDCPEVQGQWTIFPCEHNWAYHARSGLLLAGWQISEKDIDFPGGFIWLPRQDQIQEMMSEEIKTRDIDKDFNIFQLLLYDFYYDWLSRKTYGYSDDWGINSSDLDEYTSFEQLWLAFYMYEKYGRIWDGEMWNRCGTEETDKEKKDLQSK